MILKVLSFFVLHILLSRKGTRIKQYLKISRVSLIWHLMNFLGDF